MASHAPTKDDIRLKTAEACKNVGIFIRSERKKRGITQEKLAEFAGISEKYLSSIENGKEGNISLGYLVAVGLVLEIELNDWFRQDEP
ncbi:helix-turn-helix domain-containing protein [Marinagarivorans cellulosilyticus]|nr:helix-turn-helix transcriptional regulator [Marinagarivorans cellulosilyticus]